MDTQAYSFLKTSDGSPTLIFQGEAMHNDCGAFGETLYVYGEAVRYVLSQNWDPSFVSVGFGLGYVEMMLAGFLITSQIRTFRLESFEASDLLRGKFLTWLAGRGTDEFSDAYQLILNRFASHFEVDPADIKDVLNFSIQSGIWKLRGPLKKETPFPQKASCLFFDAFSRDTSPELWKGDFFLPFLQKCAGEKSVFSTYASFGALKKNLKDAGFVLIPRRGFGTKKESTFAVKIQNQQ